MFDPARGVSVPKARFAYLFPSSRSALVQVRLRPDLSDAERDRTIGLIKAATRLPDLRLPNGKGVYVVSGAPVVLSSLTSDITSSIKVLLIAALIVMALTLLASARRSAPRGAVAAARRGPGGGGRHCSGPWRSSAPP